MASIRALVPLSMCTLLVLKFIQSLDFAAIATTAVNVSFAISVSRCTSFDY